MAAKPVAADVDGWAAELDAAAVLLGRHLSRSEPRQRAADYLRGRLTDVARKNGWQLAERAGAATPHGVQHLLGRADRSADAARDDLVRYAHRTLADPLGVLVVDETGFLKKGGESAGVGRRYSGTAGRVENCQVGAFLAFAGRKGRALIDRALYLPKDWAADPARREQAGVPADVAFATEPRLAEGVIERARRLGVRAAWGTGDAVYGYDGAVRRFLERAGQPAAGRHHQ